MMPDTATLAPVASVAATMTVVRRYPVCTPNARASSSGSASKLIRHASAMSTNSDATTAGRSVAKSRVDADAKLPISQNVIAGSWL